MGQLACTWRDPEQVRDTLRALRNLTDQPFGANFVLGFPFEDRLGVALEEGVRIIFFWGDASPYVHRVKAAGALAIRIVGSVDEAKRATEAGLDVVVAQGREAGGHVRGKLSTMALVPQVVDAVAALPVIAAGGIADHRGVAAALSLGAAGVYGWAPASTALLKRTFTAYIRGALSHGGLLAPRPARFPEVVVSDCGARYQFSMPRPAKHNQAAILAAAASIVSARGPSAATITAISTAVGAPSGSIYHRFRSRDELLGRLWLTTAEFFQNRWAEALKGPDPRQAGLQAALSLPRAVREDQKGARIMLLHRREDFLSSGWPREMQKEAERLGNQVEDALADITRRLFGRNTVSARQVATFAVLDLPFSTVRRFVATGQALPPLVDDLIARAYAAVIDDDLLSEHRGRSHEPARARLDKH